MNRETNAHFSELPTVGIGRSKFDRSFDHKTTFNAGELIPIFFDATITPGDTIKMDMAEVVRMMTPITPVMDNANLDIYFFFVPYRLVWKHLAQFFGENDTAPWIQQIEYEIPQIEAPTGGWTKGSLADHFGWPTEVDHYEGSALGFRSYAKVVNDWFIDQNNKNPLYIHDGDATLTGVDILDANLDPVTDIELGACCFNAAKSHDYFTSCLPGMQKGPSVPLPLGETAPVRFGENHVASGPTNTNVEGSLINIAASNNSPAIFAFTDDGTNKTSQISNSSANTLVADLSQAVGSTVSALRQAFAIQRFYEKQALYGTRYIEFIKGHFQVTNPDFRLQRSEYLGGTRIPINVNQVVATNQTQQQLGGEYEEGVWKWEMSDLAPQGNTAAYSLTSSRDEGLFTHSFTEHGIVLGLAVVRLASHTYQQGLNKMWSRKKFLEFYMPEFANLSNTAVLNKEIYLQGSNVVNSDTGKPYDEEVFGYQEAWADYRYMPDIVTGEMRSNYSQSLDIWHWADDYNSLPHLSSDWIDEDKTNFERTLAVQNHDQFFGDFYFKCIYTRPMPLYSVPGLIDHH